MTRYKAFVFLLACVLWYAPKCVFAQARHGIEVSVDLARSADSDVLFLEYTLTNPTQEPLSIDLSDLPTEWNQSSVLVAVVFAPYPKTLPPLIPLLFPLMGKIQIPPGERLTKRMNLFDRFPDLCESLYTGDVMLLWAYQPNVFESDHTTWQNGIISVPKRTRNAETSRK